MERRHFLHKGLFALAFAALPKFGIGAPVFPRQLRVRLLRHASLLIELHGMRILVDPMLSKKDAMEPVANAERAVRVPMVDMPISDSELDKIIREVDAVLVTHTHRDHWDTEAQSRLPKDLTILCQPENEDAIRDQGFTNVHAIGDMLDWHGIRIHRTNGQHGTGEIGKKMGSVSGFVLKAGSHRLYIAGDTIWCNDVADALRQHQPNHIIVNAGGARFKTGGPITMNGSDILSMLDQTNAPLNIVHLETLSHCGETRQYYRDIIDLHNLGKRVFVPDDGEWLKI